MKKVIFLLFIQWIFIINVSADTLVNVGIYQNEPKVFMNENAKPSGFFIDIIDAIAKQENLELHYIPCQWNECLNMLEKGSIDIMPDMAYSTEREKRFLFGHESIISSWSVLYISKAVKIESILDLNQKSIAVLKNSIQSLGIKKLLKEFDIESQYEEVESFQEAFELLSDQKVDCVVVNRFYKFHEAIDKNVVRTNIMVDPTTLKFAFSKTKDDLRQVVDSNIKLMKANQNSVYYQAKKRWLEIKEKETIPNWLIWVLLGSLIVIFVLSFLVFLFKKIMNHKIKDLIKLEEDKIENFEKTLMSFVELVDDRDTYTAGHSERVASYCKEIAKEMGKSDEECELIYKAGILHDIGKVVTPDSVLLKPGQLNKLEYELIQEHVTTSYNILSKIPMYKEIAEIIFCHHEHYDGTGYPRGLKGDEITPLAQIMIVADAFDAMTSSRIYKSHKDVPEAITEIEACSGTQFDPKVVVSAKKVLSSMKTDNFVSQIPKSEIEKKRFDYYYKDQIADVYNANYLDFVLSRNAINEEYLCINILYLHNFSQYNAKHGWRSGDLLLKKFAIYFVEHFPSSTIFRIHGDDFVIVSQDHMEIDLDQYGALEIVKNTGVFLEVQRIDLHTQKVENFNDLENYLR